MCKIQNPLVVRVGMDGGHQAALDLEVFMQNLDERREAIGGAGGVGNDVVFLRIVQVVVDPHDDRDVLLLRGCGNQHLFCAAAGDMHLCLFPGRKKTCRFDHDIDPHLFPHQPGRILLGKDPHLFAVDDHGAIFGLNIPFVNTVHGIIFKKVGERFGVREIVDRNPFDGRISLSRPDDVSPDSSKTVDSYSGGHWCFPPLFSPPVKEAILFMMTYCIIIRRCVNALTHINDVFTETGACIIEDDRWFSRRGCVCNANIRSSAAFRHADAVAVHFHRALAAKGGDRATNIPSEGYEQRVEALPIFGGKLGSEGEFGLFRGFRPDVPPSVGNPVHMGVHADAGPVEPQGYDQICGLSTHPLERQQLLDALRDAGMKTSDELPANMQDGPGLVAVEADGVDRLLDPTFGKPKHAFRRGSQREEPLGGGRGHFVFGPEAKQRGNQDFERILSLLGQPGDDRNVPFQQFPFQKSDDFIDHPVIHACFRNLQS